MPFTDDDLKWFKEAHRSTAAKALLARLEAAEKLLSWEWAEPPGNYQELLKAWRKAAGRE